MGDETMDDLGQAVGGSNRFDDDGNLIEATDDILEDAGGGGHRSLVDASEPLEDFAAGDPHNDIHVILGDSVDGGSSASPNQGPFDNEETDPV